MNLAIRNLLQDKTRMALSVAGVALAMMLILTGLIPIYQLVWLGLVLVCPLMMFLMMRGMYGDRSGGGHSSAAMGRSPRVDDGIGQYPRGVS